MEVGFIGIGQMGRHMSRRILEAGHSLVVHDLNQDAAAPLLQKGARWGRTPQEVAASCQVVITCLPTPKNVEEVVYGQNGLKSGWKNGDIYVDMSTDSPSTVRRIARDAGAMGVAVLDAPVSGGTKGAEMGTLAIMVGGDAATLEKVRKVLEAMGKSIFHVGDVGCGNIAKLVNNLISLTINSITAEGFVLGMKAGIDPKVLRDVVMVSTGSNWTLQQYPETLFARNFEPGFKVSLGLKDISLAIDMGKELGVPLPVGTVVQEDLRAAMNVGYADKNVGAVALNLEKAASVTVRAR